MEFENKKQWGHYSNGSVVRSLNITDQNISNIDIDEQPSLGVNEASVEGLGLKKGLTQKPLSRPQTHQRAGNTYLGQNLGTNQEHLAYIDQSTISMHLHSFVGNPHDDSKQSSHNKNKNSMALDKLIDNSYITGVEHDQEESEQSEQYISTGEKHGHNTPRMLASGAVTPRHMEFQSSAKFGPGTLTHGTEGTSPSAASDQQSLRRPKFAKEISVNNEDEEEEFHGEEQSSQPEITMVEKIVSCLSSLDHILRKDREAKSNIFKLSIKDLDSCVNDTSHMQIFETVGKHGISSGDLKSYTDLLQNIDMIKQQRKQKLKYIEKFSTDIQMQVAVIQIEQGQRPKEYGKHQSEKSSQCGDENENIQELLGRNVLSGLGKVLGERRMQMVNVEPVAQHQHHHHHHHNNNIGLNIRDYLDKTEMKIKDAQIKRLQEKVKLFTNAEQALQNQIQSTHTKDQNLVQKLQKSVCFGQVFVIEYKEERIDHLYENLMQELNIDGDSSEDEEELLEKIKQVFEYNLLEEFDQIFKSLRGKKQTGQQLYMQLSGTQKLNFFKDSYMMQKIDLKMQFSSLDIYDLGVNIDCENYLKITLHDENSRKVFLISIPENQFEKWKLALTSKIQSSNENLDQALIEIKKSICQRKGAKYRGESFDSRSNSMSETFPNIHDQFVKNQSQKKFEPNLEPIDEIAILSDGGSSRDDTGKHKKNYSGKKSQISDQISNFGGTNKISIQKRKNELESIRAAAYRQLIAGQVFLKYGTWGYPKQKHIYFDGKAIRWRPNTQEGHKKIEKSTSKYGQDKKKALILVGSEGATGDLIFKFNRESKQFKRYKVAKEIEDLSFSIAIKGWNGKMGRELCLEAASKELMMQFINNLKIISRDFPRKPEFVVQNIKTEAANNE